MFCQFTKKSLIVSAALAVALIWTGVIAASANATFPATSQHVTPSPQGIPAIASPRGNALISVPTVIRYLHTRGFAAGPTQNGTAPSVQSVQLTSASNLNRLTHIFIPGLPAKTNVYYARLKGPLTVSPTPPRSVLSTLLPSAGNLPILRPLLPDMSHTPGLGSLLNSLPLLSDPANEAQSENSKAGLSPSTQRPQGTQRAGQQKTTGGHKAGRRRQTSLGKLPGARPPGLGVILQQAYEVFDAHTGNLLAWG